MTFLATFEAWCAEAVERFFARAFPGPLEPIQIARRLIATLEHDPPPAGDGPASRYVVRVSTSDSERLATEKAGLERQWSKMASALCARGGIDAAHPPVVVIVPDADLITGTVAVDAVHPETGMSESAQVFRLRVERGVASGATYALPRPTSADVPLTVGRDPACDVVVMDPRVSRRHLRISAGDRVLRFEDLASSNGTYRNGERTSGAELRPWDRLEIGDTVFAVEPLAADARA